MTTTTTAPSSRSPRRAGKSQRQRNIRDELRRQYIDAGWSWVLFRDEPAARKTETWSGPTVEPLYTPEEAALLDELKRTATLRAFDTREKRALAGVVIDMTDGAAPQVYVRMCPDGFFAILSVDLPHDEDAHQ